MNQKWLYAGIILIAAGLFLNGVAIAFLNLQDPIIPGEQPHSRPPVVGTTFLVLIPIGFILVIRHFVLMKKSDSKITSPFQEPTTAEN